MSSIQDPEVCERAFKVTFHPVYRGSQFLQFFILLFAIFPLSHFLWFKMRKSSVHGNLKWLLIGYFGSLLLFTVHLMTLAIIQIIHPMLSIDNCDLIFDRFNYAIGTILGVFLMIMSTFFPISITIERFLAMKLAEKYDKTPVALGPIMTIFNIILNCFITYKIFQTETFGTGSATIVLVPSTSASKIYTVYWSMFFLNMINLFFNFKLLRLNSRLKRIDVSLSAKYQMEEVYSSTVFSVSVIFLHISFYGIYVSLTILLRFFGALVFESTVTLPVVRGAFITMIAIYNLLVGCVAVYLYKKLKNKKSLEISGTIEMKSTGGAGAMNYDRAINNIWNSHSKH